MVYVTEPILVKEMLANYYKFAKARGGNPIIRKLMKGVIDAKGDKWVKHRKIINPAFHVEKLKVYSPFSLSITILKKKSNTSKFVYICL